MTPVEALKLSLSKEKASIDFYNKLNLKHPSLKELFSFLINEEEKHKLLIEKKIVLFTQ